MNRIKLVHEQTERMFSAIEKLVESFVNLHPRPSTELVQVLKAAKPLHVTESDHVFKNTEGRPLDFHTWRAKHWYRALRANGMKERKPYATRHTFISVGLSNGVNIKWLAEYCGTSVAMVEKHYGKYVRGDVDEQFRRLLAPKTKP